MRRMDVHEAANRRLKIIFDYFDYVYVSFSGGKDSGILLHLCMDYIRMHAPGRKLGVFHMDYEVQYRQSTEYVERMFSNNRDILEVFHCCVPFKVPTCTSMYQQYWRPWQEGYQNIWVRQMPGTALTVKDFDFWNDSLWDYDFQSLFPSWIRRKKGCKRVCCLVGIRTQESFNRWRAIHSDKNYRKLANYKWTHRVGYYTYNAYPIYDWKTTDVWTGYARYGWDYNRLYDLYYQAGILPCPARGWPARLSHRPFRPCIFIKLLIRIPGDAWSAGSTASVSPECTGTRLRWAGAPSVVRTGSRGKSTCTSSLTRFPGRQGRTTWRN